MLKWLILPIIAVVGVPALAGPIVVGSQVQLAVSANVVGWGAPVIDTDSASQGATLNPLNASVSATHVAGEFFTHVGGSVSATWDSANVGAVTITDLGWDTYSADYAAYLQYSEFLIYPPQSWSYTFIPETDSTFTVDWSYFVTGVNFFAPSQLEQYSFAFSLARDFSLEGPDTIPSNSTGSLSYALLAGHTYTAFLGPSVYGSVGGFSEPRELARNMNGDFNWSITAAEVPIPGTIGLLAIGALAAARLRRNDRRNH
jgi:hypothetical protein